MTGNPLPWLILLGVVVATLAFKGYIKLPAARPGKRSSPPESIPGPPPQPLDLSHLDSRALGLAFAIAKRREAEEELAHQIAEDAGKAIKETFQAPFSPAAPAGPDPAK